MCGWGLRPLAKHKGGHHAPHLYRNLAYRLGPLLITGMADQESSQGVNMRSYLLRNVDKFMDFIDRGSRFWGIVLILFAMFIFAPVILRILF